MVLNKLGIDRGIGEEVDKPADDAAETVRNLVDTHMLSTSSEHVINWVFGVTFLNDVSSDQTTLRETEHVEWGVSEDHILLDGLTCV